MILPIALSLFFGCVATFALAVCGQSARRALRQAREIRAEIAAIEQEWRTAAAAPWAPDQAPVPVSAPAAGRARPWPALGPMAPDQGGGRALPGGVAARSCLIRA